MEVLGVCLTVGIQHQPLLIDVLNLLGQYGISDTHLNLQFAAHLFAAFH